MALEEEVEILMGQRFCTMPNTVRRIEGSEEPDFPLGSGAEAGHACCLL